MNYWLTIIINSMNVKMNGIWNEYIKLFFSQITKYLITVTVAHFHDSVILPFG